MSTRNGRSRRPRYPFADTKIFVFRDQHSSFPTPTSVFRLAFSDTNPALNHGVTSGCTHGWINGSRNVCQDVLPRICFLSLKKVKNNINMSHLHLVEKGVLQRREDTALKNAACECRTTPQSNNRLMHSAAAPPAPPHCGRSLRQELSNQ